MKKLFAFVLVMTILFTGCGKNLAITAEAKEYGYFNFDNLEWGITPAEMMKTLDKKESDFTIEKGEIRFENQIESTYELTNTSYLDYDATIQYTFLGIVDSKENQSLSKVKITFSNAITQENIDAIWQSIETTVQSFGIETIKQSQMLTSKATTINLPEEMQSKANAYMQKVYLENADILDLRNPNNYEFTKATQLPLSRAKISMQANDKGTVTGVVEFWGEGIAHTKLFEKLENS